LALVASTQVSALLFLFFNRALPGFFTGVTEIESPGKTQISTDIKSKWFSLPLRFDK